MQLRALGTGRLGLLLLLLNAMVVATAAVLRHASADDVLSAPATDARPATAQADTAQADTGEPAVGAASTLGAPPASSIAAENSPVDQVDQKEARQHSPTVGDSVPGLPPSASAQSATSDPVLEELRKLVRDPASGLDLPLIQLPPLDTAQPPPSQSPTRATGGWTQLQRRVDSVHHISCAAKSLSLEAQELARAGQTSQAESLMLRVAELHAIIARLTSAK